MAQDRPIGNMRFGVGFDGIDESLNTLDKLNRALKQSESSMKATMSTFDKAGASAEDLSRKEQALIDTTELQAKKIQLLEKRREEYIQTYGKESKQVASVTTQINNATVKYNKLAKELDSTKQAYIVASSGVDKYSKAIKENEQAMNEEIKAFKESGDKAGELQAKQRGLAKQAELTEQAINAQKQAISKMAKEFGESSTQVKQAESKLDQFTRTAQNTDTRLAGVNDALNKLQKEAGNVDTKLDKASDGLQEVSSEAKKSDSGLKDATQSFGALAGGMATAVSIKALDTITEGVNAVKEAFTEALDSQNKLVGTLGATSAEAKKYTSWANDLVASGIAENVDEATDAMIKFKHALPDNLQKDPGQLKWMAQNALTLSKTFDMDVNEVVRGATRMMQNFGLTGEEAFDYLAEGAQRGLDQSGELADNMAEYSQLFGQMGYSAGTTFSLLEAGLDGGAYNLDKVNDLIKEMGISLTDGRFEDNADMFSESTRKLFNEWKNGRATQADVVQGMMQDFAKMDNGYGALNKAGTVWSALGEDNSLKVIQAMAQAGDTFTDTSGKMEQINEVAGNTTVWDAFSSGIKSAVTDIGIYLSEFNDGALIDGVTSFFEYTVPRWGKDLAWFVDSTVRSIKFVTGVIKDMWSGKFKTSDYGILNAIGFDTETIWQMEDYVNTIKQTVEPFGKYISGFWKLFSNDKATSLDGYSILRSLGLSKDQIAEIEAGFGKIKSFLDEAKRLMSTFFKAVTDVGGKVFVQIVELLKNQVLPAIMPLITTIADGFRDIFSFISDWWDKHGTRVGDAVVNLIKMLSPILAVAIVVIKSFVDSVIGFIKGMVMVITGVIDVFSAVLTGDFTGMWESIKNIFFGAIQAIWNWINIMFIGKIFKAVGAFGGSIKTLFTGMWTGIKNIFSGGIGSVNGFISGFVSKTWNFFKSLGSNLGNTVSDMWTGIKNTFSGGIDTVLGWVKSMPNTMAEGIKAGAKFVKDAFKDIFNGVLNAIGGPVNGIIGGANWVLEKLGADKLPEWDIPQYAKGTPVGGHPINGPMMVNDGRGAETVITPDGRAFIPKGRNVVLNAPKGTHVLTAEETAQLQGSKAPKYRYKKGTGFFSNLWSNVKGFAGNVGDKLKGVVGDVWDFVSNPGKLAEKVLNGLGVLKDLVKYPLDVGKGILSKATSALTSKITELFSGGNLDLGTGTAGVYKYLADVAKSVLSKFPGFQITSGYREGDQYSHGKRNAIDIALPGVTGGSSKYTEAANYAFEKFASKVGYVITNGKVRDRSGQSGQPATGAWETWPAGDHYDHVHINGIKDPQNKQISGENITGSGVERWRGIATQALKMTGQYNTANLNALMNQMRTESNGNPKAINLWDPNAMKGTPSKGLMQVIDPTFKAYAMPGFNSNIYDPLSNILASIKYALATYGSLTNAYRGVGYENGGIIKKQHMAMVGEGNKEEVVIPLTGSGLKRSRAMQLLAYANEKLNNQKQATVTAETPKNNDMATVVSLLQQQNELLMAILQKDTNILLDGQKVNSKLEKIRATQQRNTNRDLGLV